jgi:hypothetical protein
MKSCGRKVESKVTQALLLQKLHFWIFACDQKFFWSVRRGLESSHDSCGEVLQASDFTSCSLPLYPLILFVYHLNYVDMPTIKT